MLLMHGSAFTMMHNSGKMVNRTLFLQLKRSFQSKYIENKRKLTKDEKAVMVLTGAAGLLAVTNFLLILKDCKDRYHKEKYEALCREHYIFPYHRQRC
jgi:hypothetical protein